MSIKKSVQLSFGAALLLVVYCQPTPTQARNWETWAQRGINILKRGAQYQREQSGSYEGGHQSSPSYSHPPSSSGSSSPGSNYYPDAETMRIPTRHHQQEQQEQPAYTPPAPSYTPPAPTYQPRYGYGQRSAYHTGSDASSDSDTSASSRTQTQRRHVPPRIPVARHTERPAVLAVTHTVTPPVKPTPAPIKPEVLTPADVLDTSWIIPTVGRLESKLHSKS